MHEQKTFISLDKSSLCNSSMDTQENFACSLWPTQAGRAPFTEQPADVKPMLGLSGQCRVWGLEPGHLGFRVLGLGFSVLGSGGACESFARLYNNL